MMSMLSTVKGIISGNPAQAFEAEIQNNPQFAKFVKEHQTMTVNDLISQSGMDPAMLQMLFK